MRRELGLLLRMFGPFIEILAVLAYIQYGGRTIPGLGVPVRIVCFAAMGLGLVMVLLGLALSFLGTRRGRRESAHRGFDLNLGADPPPESETFPEPSNIQD